jgi:hypothetical protein
LAISHKTITLILSRQVPNDFPKSRGTGLLINQFDATVAIFIHLNKPSDRGEVARQAAVSM